SAHQPASSKLTLIRPSGMSRGRLSYTTSWDTIRKKTTHRHAAGQRVASWLGFIVGLCCGMSITAVLAISILGN
ncbi:hypothetical protein, partial [Martelella sp. AD-3]|uniref:hypothetical protein n=1 Tax=Martelella sp. AD-3 TaxID=686597 RepID=UPI001AEBCD65